MSKNCQTLKNGQKGEKKMVENLNKMVNENFFDKNFFKNFYEKNFFDENFFDKFFRQKFFRQNFSTKII